MVSYPGALILEALLLVVLAPAAGVVVRSPRWLIAGVIGIAAVSLAAHASAPDAAMPPTVLAHVLMAACGLALAGLGRAASAWLEDPLDALGASLCAAVVLAGGLFAVGSIGLDLPTRVVNVALAASPIVAITSAGSVDVLRSGILYDLSPIAHREFTYPSVLTTGTVHGSIAVITLFASYRRGRAPAAPAHC